MPRKKKKSTEPKTHLGILHPYSEKAMKKREAERLKKQQPLERMFEPTEEKKEEPKK